MNLPSIDVPLFMSTMLAENQLIQSSKIYGLSVRGFNSSKKIKLPALFTRNIMPASRSHIPSPETTRRWPHLQKLETKIPVLQNCTIALLLGTNVYKVLEPDGFILPGDSNGPFAVQTDLGWSLVGPATGFKGQCGTYRTTECIIPKSLERVVFDCSAKYQGFCLNDILLQGSDLINLLIGDLNKFRKGRVAFVCYVEKMFFQFSVCEDHRDFADFCSGKMATIKPRSRRSSGCKLIFLARYRRPV